MKDESKTKKQLQLEITERVQANEELHESEARFRTIFDNSPDAIFIEDAEGYVLDVNPAACRLQRIDREHLIGKHVLELVPPDKRNEVARDFPKVASGEWDTAQGFSLTANGQSVPVEIRSRPIVYSGKAAVLLIVRDITERRRAEEAIRYRADFEHLIAGLSSDFVRLNAGEVDAGIERALQVIGEFAEVDRSYVFLFRDGKKMVDNTHEWCADGIEPQMANLQNLPSESVPWWMDKLYRHENVYVPSVDDLPPEAGFEKEMLNDQDIQSLVVVPMVSEDNLVGFLGFDSVRSKKEWPENIAALLRIAGDIFTNSLERKRFESYIKEYTERLELEVEQRTLALRESEAKHRDLIEKISEGVITLDGELRVSFVNSAFSNMLGYRTEDLIGRHFTEIPWVDEENMAILIRESEKRKKLQSARYELKTRHKSGRIVDVLASATPMQGPDGEFAGSYTVVTDITEQKRLERDLVDLSARLVDLQEQERRRIAGELHDAIGGALTGMAIELELLSKTPALEGKPPEPHLLSIRDQIHSTIDMVQRISYELRPAILDDLGLSSAMRWYIDSFRARTGIKARLRISLTEERLPEAIEIALFRITQEALTNVFRHSKAASVSVTLSKRRNSLWLSIKDNGVGFDPDDLTQEPQKRGFGLFGIKERLKGVGGRLDLQSEPGKGTRLVATIPLGPR